MGHFVKRERSERSFFFSVYSQSSDDSDPNWPNRSVLVSLISRQLH